MRKLLFIFSLLSIVSCSSPKDQAHDFLEAMSRKDFDTAMEMSTQNTQEIIKEFMMSDAVTEDLSGLDFKIMGCAELEDGSTIRCGYFVIDNGEQMDDLKTIDLVKVEGEWKVDLKP